MRLRCLLTALFGLWFLFAPWIIGFTEVSAAVRVSVVLGAVQFFASVWALITMEGSWPYWITLITGLIFAIAPFTVSFLAIGQILFLAVFGLSTFFLSFSNLESK